MHNSVWIVVTGNYDGDIQEIEPASCRQVAERIGESRVEKYRYVSIREYAFGCRGGYTEHRAWEFDKELPPEQLYSPIDTKDE